MANIKHVNSVVDRDFRNRINQLIDVVNGIGTNLNDLVVKGVMTTEQYSDLLTAINGLVKIGEVDIDTLSTELKSEIEKINNKIDKGNVSIFDINKNLGKIDQTFLTDELLQQIAGSTPINTVPADNSIDTDKLIDGSVTKAKRTVGGESAYAMPGTTSKTPNIDTIKKTITFYGTTFFYHSKGRVSVQADTSVEFPASGSIVVAIDINSGGISARSGAEMFTLSESEVVLMHIVFTSTTQSNVKSVASNFDVTVNGKPIEKELITSSVTTDKLSDGAATRDKRTANGETAILVPSMSAKKMNINTKDKQFEIYGTSFIYWRNKRIRNDDDIIIPWEPSGSQLLTYNTVTNEFNSRSGGNYTLISEDDILIAHIVFTTASQSEIKSIKALTDFTVDGDEYYAKYKGEKEASEKVINEVYAHTPLSEFVATPIMETAESGSPNYIKNKTHTDIYAEYDNLMDRHPSIMSSSVPTLDDWGNEVRRYDVKPPEMLGAEEENKVPKILWAVSTHGSEKTAGWTAFKTIEYILDNYKTDKTLQNFIYNNHIIILPVVNPSGWDDNTRKNRNGVDLNRNQPTGWSLLEESNVVYGGPSALSEKESVVIHDIIHTETNLKYVADFHNFFIPVEPNHFIWIPSKSKQIINIARSFIYSFTHEIKKEYPDLPDDTFFGYTSQTRPGGSISIESVSNGVYGNTFEVGEVFKIGDDVLNSSMVITAGVKAFLNWNILMCHALRTIDNEMK